MALRCAVVALSVGLASAGAFRGWAELPSKRRLQNATAPGNDTTTTSGFAGAWTSGSMPDAWTSSSMPDSNWSYTTQTYTVTGFQYGITPLVFDGSLTAPGFAYLYQGFQPVLSSSNNGTSRADQCWSKGAIPCVVPQWGDRLPGGYTTTNYTVVCSVGGQCPCSAGSKLCNATAPYTETPTAQFVGLCLPNSVQTCPVTCQKPCATYTYDSYGNMVYDGYSVTIAALTCDGCACDATWEQQCQYDGSPQCMPKAYGDCPLNCGAGALACTVEGFDIYGMSNYNQSCVSNVSYCTWPMCDNTTADVCTGTYGNYCAPKGQCPPPPVSCEMGQQVCFGQNASTSGTIMDVGMCMDASVPCPCRAEQNNCASSFGWSYCSDYPCPVSCKQGEQVCYGQNASTAYTALDVGVCMNASVQCPCREGQQNCTSSDNSYSWCSDYACPVYCSPDQQLCFGQNASTRYTSLDVGVCMDAAKTCPCGDLQTCNAFGMTYCADSCPLDCGDASVNQTCTIYNYFPDGSLDWGSLDDLVCKPVGTPCPCGNNSMPCNIDGSSYCLPTVVEGFATQCPMNCPEQQCFIVDYDAQGNFAGYKQSCAAFNATCPCSGNNTQACKDEFGNSFCLPTVDSSTGQKLSCPVVCNAVTENTCHMPRYDLDGNVLAVTTQCVPNGQSCPCPSQVTVAGSNQPIPTNARPCNYTLDDNSSYVDCMPSAYYKWCPTALKCPNDKPYACPAPAIFDKVNGSFVDMGNPYCAENADKCGCGDASSALSTNAINCNVSDQTFCFPKIDPLTLLPFKCAQDCQADTPQKCDVIHFDAAGVVTRQEQKCAVTTETCPCGDNAVKSESGVCLSKVASDALKKTCPDGQFSYWVEDFNATTGESLGKSQKCQMIGKAGECGSGAYGVTQGGPCKDPVDNSTICIPQAFFGRYGCPTPCTPAQEALGKSTCVQTHLDKSGNYVATSVNCVNNTGACEPGQNQKKCPSGAMIFTGAVCQDLYGLAGNSSNSSVGLPAGSRQESTMVMSLDSGNITSDSLGKLANNVQANLNSVLQIGSDLQLDVTFAAVSSTGKTSGRRLAANSKVQAVITVKSSGKAAVAPSVVAAKAKSMANTGTDSFSKAFAGVGKPDTKAGFSTSSSTKTLAKAAPAKATNSTAPVAVAQAGATTQPVSAAQTTQASAVQTSQVPGTSPTTTAAAATTMQVKGSANANGGNRGAPAAATVFSLAAIAVAFKL